MSEHEPALNPWNDALHAAALFAVAPALLGGVHVKARHGAARDEWLSILRSLLPHDAPFAKLPLNATDESLFGGVDLSATLASKKLVRAEGLLARIHGGLLTIPLAERLSESLAARLGAALDAQVDEIEQEDRAPRKSTCAGFGIIALDEGGAEEALPAILRERLAIFVDLSAVGRRDLAPSPFDPADMAEAKDRLFRVEMPDSILAALCAASLQLGIASMRGLYFAALAARASAALARQDAVTQEDAELVARLVLAPRARFMPVQNEAASSPETSPDRQEGDRREEAQQNGNDSDSLGSDTEMSDRLVSTARAAIPPSLLSRLTPGPNKARAKSTGGRSNVFHFLGTRGRPVGVRPVRDIRSERINLIETIRTAVPWQSIRRRENPDRAERVHIRRSDIRVGRYKSHAQTTAIFAVDASGSAALQRLSEAKGAVELMLADCYVRRDQVALLAFRGTRAEIILPPTRSLVRAKRSLTALAGGGGTPLAAGIGAASGLAVRTRQGGGLPLIILLTDGRANIAASGEASRDKAQADAIAAARALRKAQIPALLVDVSPRPQARAEQLAREMGALYMPLPYADARAISQAARSLAAA